MVSNLKSLQDSAHPNNAAQWYRSHWATCSLVGCARLSLQLQVPQWVHQKFYCDLFKAAISCQTMAGIQCSPTRAMLSTHPPARKESLLAGPVRGAGRTIFDSNLPTSEYMKFGKWSHLVERNAPSSSRLSNWEFNAHEKDQKCRSWTSGAQIWQRAGRAESAFIRKVKKAEELRKKIKVKKIGRLAEAPLTI